MTWMWAMCGRVSDGPFARRAAATASSDVANGAVADRVEVRLEPERVEPGDGPSERLPDRSERCRGCRRARAVASEIRVEHRAREGLEDAVDHQLHAVSAR